MYHCRWLNHQDCMMASWMMESYGSCKITGSQMLQMIDNHIVSQIVFMISCLMRFVYMPMCTSSKLRSRLSNHGGGAIIDDQLTLGWLIPSGMHIELHRWRLLRPTKTTNYFFFDISLQALNENISTYPNLSENLFELMLTYF